MAKKKIRHFKTPVVRSDSLDLSPTTDYESIAWKTADHSQDYEALDDRYKYDAIAHKMVSKVAEDATRNGFRLVIPGKPDLQEMYQNRLNNLKTQQVLSQQIIYQRKHGDGYIAYLVKETNPTSTFDPLDSENIENVVALHAVGQKNVQSYLTDDDQQATTTAKSQN